ncbi:MAG: hypothetical protein C0395_10365 [Gemmatimonas sp.]|nr:hypothetical protein [Gemmatimonas sp.]
MTTPCARTDLLQDLLDGDLDASAAAALRRHLGDCPACATAWADLQRLQRETAALPHEIAPGRDLWPGIAERLAADPRPADAPAPRERSGLFSGASSLRQPRRALALAAVLVVAIALPRLMDRSGGTADPGEELGDGYALLHAASKSALERTGEDLTAADRDELDDGFAAIEKAIGETRRALRQTRRDPSLTPGLAAGYHRKLDLMQRLVSRVAQS